jgi:hypothetical protein
MGNGPPTPSQALRRRVRPPLGGRTTVERPRGGVSPRVRTDEVESTRLLRVLIPSTLLQAVAGRDPFLSAHWQRGGPGFFFNRDAGALSSSDMGLERIDGDSVPSRTTAVVTQKDESR